MKKILYFEGASSWKSSYRQPSFFWKGRLLNSSSFTLIAAFNSAIVKNCPLRRAAVIHVEMFPAVPSALGLSFGVLTRAGMIAVP